MTKTIVRLILAGGLVSLTLLGCGGSQPETAVPEAESAASAKESTIETEPAQQESAAEELEPEVSKGVPNACAGAGEDCLPPQKWVSRLCDGVFAEVALFMFKGGTPWQRLYLRGKTAAVNASGGASVAGFLEFDEEVIALRHRGGGGDGIQIGDGSGQYDALRWNGSCVSLEGGEVTTSKPPKPKHSRIEWKWLGEEMRDALKRDQDVAETYRARRKECKGATMGAVSKKCEQLDVKLVDVIAAYVRSGADLPEPSEQP